MSVRIKTLPFEVKDIDEQGKFKGYASTRKKDTYGDTIEFGAFKRTIELNEGVVPILDMHMPTLRCGLSSVLREEEHGLYTEGQLNLEKQYARDVYSDMKFTVGGHALIDRMSIGYTVLQGAFDQARDVYAITELKLWEYSLVTRNFAANDEALISGVKSLEQFLGQVTGIKSIGANPELVIKAIDALAALLPDEAKARMSKRNLGRVRSAHGQCEGALATLAEILAEMADGDCACCTEGCMAGGSCDGSCCADGCPDSCQACEHIKTDQTCATATKAPPPAGHNPATQQLSDEAAHAAVELKALLGEIDPAYATRSAQDPPQQSGDPALATLRALHQELAHAGRQAS